MKYQSDNIAQFFVSEADALNFPVTSVVSHPKHGWMKYREDTLVGTEVVDGIADVFRQIGTMRDRRSLP